MRSHRYIPKVISKSKDSTLCLSDHEITELKEDFDIKTEGYFVVNVLTKKEWDKIRLDPVGRGAERLV